MKELRGNHVGWLAGSWAALLTAIVATVLLAPVSWARASGEPLPAPTSFRVAASNGYTLLVLSGVNPRTKVGGVVLVARSRHTFAYYATRASVTATSIEADFGSLGRIDVDYVPTGGTRTEGLQCTKDSIAFEAGNYVGVIDFYGEEGYSEAHATSARGTAKPALLFLCDERLESEGSGGHSPGAKLIARHTHSPKFVFEARKNSPIRPARFTATVNERRGAVRIFRAVSVPAAASGTFAFDVPGGFARVSPPVPFSGSAIYRKHDRQASWAGDLAVDFPGLSGVNLTGPGVLAGMHRAVLNPSHPFRVR